jgi:hypothetical protein
MSIASFGIIIAKLNPVSGVIIELKRIGIEENNV